MQEGIVTVLMHHGFQSQQDVALSEINAAAHGLVGTGRYATVDDLIFDLVNGGTFLVPTGTPREVVEVFFHAAGYSTTNIEGSAYSDHEDQWGEV